jgi:hypothetical protein
MNPRAFRISVTVSCLVFICIFHGEAIANAQESDASATDSPELPDEIQQTDDDDPKTVEVPSVTDEADTSDVSGSFDDEVSSIDLARQSDVQVAQGVTTNGDFRLVYSYDDRESRDGSEQSSSGARGRFRIGGTYNILENLLIGGRVASTCSTDRCDPDLRFDSNP